MNAHCTYTSSVIQSSPLFGRMSLSIARVRFSTGTKEKPSTGIVPGGCSAACTPARSSIVACRSTRCTVWLYHWPRKAGVTKGPPIKLATLWPPSQCVNFAPLCSLLLPAFAVGAPLSPRKKRMVLFHIPFVFSASVRLASMPSTAETFDARRHTNCVHQHTKRKRIILLSVS